MSIMIKDMEMPEACDDCPFHVYYSHYEYVCKATPMFYPMNLANSKGIRKDWCPLLEVPERKTFRVIDTKTGKEADTYEIALHEEWAKGLIYCDMEGFAVEEDGTLILIDECGKHEYCPDGRFTVVWDSEADGGRA